MVSPAHQPAERMAPVSLTCTTPFHTHPLNKQPCTDKHLQILTTGDTSSRVLVSPAPNSSTWCFSFTELVIRTTFMNWPTILSSLQLHTSHLWASFTKTANQRPSPRRTSSHVSFPPSSALILALRISLSHTSSKWFLSSNSTLSHSQPFWKGMVQPNGPEGLLSLRWGLRLYTRYPLLGDAHHARPHITSQGATSPPHVIPE